jgi:hypothetical protein
MNDKNRRKELTAQYKEKAPEAGIYRIVNQETGKYYLWSSSDIPGVFNRFEFGRKTGTYGTLPLVMNKDLTALGYDKFSIEVLEMLKVKPDMTVQETKKELKVLMEMWRQEHGDGNEY